MKAPSTAATPLFLLALTAAAATSYEAGVSVADSRDLAAAGGAKADAAATYVDAAAVAPRLEPESTSTFRRRRRRARRRRGRRRRQVGEALQRREWWVRTRWGRDVEGGGRRESFDRAAEEDFPFEESDGNDTAFENEGEVVNDESILLLGAGGGEGGDDGKDIFDASVDSDRNRRFEMVSKLLRTIELQALQGSNCTPGQALSLGDHVVNKLSQVRPAVLLGEPPAGEKHLQLRRRGQIDSHRQIHFIHIDATLDVCPQERFHAAAKVAVVWANWLTRMWKYAPEVVGRSEYLLHANTFHFLEFNEDIFAAGNCYDAEEYDVSGGGEGGEGGQEGGSITLASTYRRI